MEKTPLVEVSLYTVSVRSEMMRKNVYLVRHCEAEGQPFESKLTDLGQKQAIELMELFSKLEVDRVISSPFLRAIQSIQPFIEKANIALELDDRLKERILSEKNLVDWMEKLQATFQDLDLKLEGGESSKEATERGVSVIIDSLQGAHSNIVLVTHGNLMALILKHYEDTFGFEEWKSLSNPDIFHLQFDNGDEVKLKRVWQKKHKNHPHH